MIITALFLRGEVTEAVLVVLVYKDFLEKSCIFSEFTTRAQLLSKPAKKDCFHSISTSF